jgi:hypothetical protein
MFVCCVCLCGQVEVSAASWSLVQMGPTDCGASLCVIEKPRERGGHSPRWAAEPEIIIIIIIKGKGHPITGHQGPRGGVEVWLYSFPTSALEGVGGKHHAPAVLPPGTTRYPLYRKLGGPQDRSGRVWKILPHCDLILGPSSP